MQLYTRDLVCSVTTYEKNLRGFERVHLEQGEEKQRLLRSKTDAKNLNMANFDYIIKGEEQ